MQVFRYHYLTWYMMYLLFVNISTRVSLSRLDISSRKSEIAHQLSVILQTNSLSNCQSFLLPCCIFNFLNFWSFTIYLLYTTVLLRKTLSMKKASSMKQHIKALVRTRKCLSELCLEVLSIEFDIKFLSFVSIKHFSGVKFYKICDALISLTQNLLLNPLYYDIPLFRLFTSLTAIHNK